MKYKYPFNNVDDGSKLRVWAKGKVIGDKDPALWRTDICGSVIKYNDHGNINSKYGWEIDHIKPTAKGGLNDFNNLQPLYWKHNREKGDIYPWTC